MQLADIPGSPSMARRRRRSRSVRSKTAISASKSAIARRQRSGEAMSGLVDQAFGIVMNTGGTEAKRWPGCVL
jgi:hypothetical protein